MLRRPSVRTAMAIGANSPSPNASRSRSKAARDGTSGGRMLASGALNRTCRNGEPSSEQHGERRDEHGERPAHDAAGEPRPRSVAPAAGSLTRRIASRSRCWPNSASSAGSRVSAARTARPTTTAPAIPTERRIMNSNSTSPSSPSRTVSPLKNTARPAVATVMPDGLARLAFVGVGWTLRELLAEAARQQQRVVDAEPQAEQGREVEHEDAHRRDRGDEEDRGERHEDARSADHERDAGRHDRAEHQQQRERRERQRDDLAALEVALADCLDVAVEGRAAGQLDRQARRLAEALAEDRQGVGRVVGRQVEQDDVVRRVAVGRDLARLEQVRDDAGRRAARSGCRAWPRRPPSSKSGVPAVERVAVEGDDERRRRDVELLLEEGLRPGRLEVVADEAAGAQRARDLRRERQREGDQDGPRRDDESGAAHDEPAESIEGSHRGSSYAAPRAVG